MVVTIRISFFFKYDHVLSIAYSRVMVYIQGSGTTGTVIFGETTCGPAEGQICYCAGIFVDDQGFVYYLDAENYRILKITPFASTATVVAGITGSPGSMPNQLNDPRGIFVDTNDNLYVADANKM
jgi:hypothetical protein